MGVFLMKHIQCKYHYVCDLVILYLTDNMVADIFTKAFPHGKHRKFCHAIGLWPGPSGNVRS